MDAHRIVIGRMSTRARIGDGGAEAWRARLHDAMSGPVPRAFGREAERLLDGRHGVIRIRRLSAQLTLWADGGAQALAESLGRRLAEALAAALASAPADEVRAWPDHAAYAASYAMMRLGLVQEPGWAFPDFAPLRLLSDTDAARSVLEAAGAAGLIALSRAPLPPSMLSLRLGPEAEAELLAAIAAGAAPEAAALGRLGRLWLALAGLGDPDGQPLALLVALLREAGAALPAGDALADLVPALAQSALAVAALAELLARPDTGRGLARRLLSGALPADADPALAAPLAAALTAALAVEGPQAAILEILAEQRHARATRAAGPEPEAAGPAPRRPAEATGFVSSAFAGLSMLLPLMPALGLGLGMEPGTLRAVALATLPEEDLAEARRDAGLAALFPADPNRPVPAPVPPDPALREGLGTLAGAALREGAGEWADLWLAALAARLPGLRDSSRGYLQRQFLGRPGRILFDEALVKVRIAHPPLGLLLRMAGLTGPQGPVAHLGGRLLMIDLAEAP